MFGYYGHQPPVLLERPLCLVGFLGAGTVAVGSALGALTGLPWIDLDRRVEHAAGRSISQLVLEKGDGALQQIEGVALRRALDARPAGIVSLGAGALRLPGSAAAVATEATSVYLRLPIEDLTRNVRRELDQQPGRYPEFMVKRSVVTVAGLEPLLLAREPAYAAATHAVDCAGKAPTTIAREIMALVGLDADLGGPPG
jgi:shikimate kinase